MRSIYSRSDRLRWSGQIGTDTADATPFPPIIHRVVRRRCGPDSFRSNEQIANRTSCREAQLDEAWLRLHFSATTQYAGETFAVFPSARRAGRKLQTLFDW